MFRMAGNLAGSSVTLMHKPQPLLALCIFALLLPFSSLRASAAEGVHTKLHLLDYLGVDYPEFVLDGKVLDAAEYREHAEYREQLEFSTQVLKLAVDLPGHAQKSAIVGQAQRLAELVQTKQPGDRVAQTAQQLAASITKTYRVEVAPKRAPDITN